MTTINIHAAKTNLSKLVDQAAAGDEIIIARAGKPVARLMPLASERSRRVLGALEGKIFVAGNFDDPLPDDVLDLFEGRDADPA
jgi:prevent-host-death family protein